MCDMAKRSYASLENIDNPNSSANVHGAVVSISPVKKGRKCLFFDGEFADDTSKIRLVGFDASQQRKLSEFHDRQVPVELQNCEIKKSRYADVYDLMLRSRSRIKESSRDINAASLIQDHDATVEAAEIQLDRLPDIDVFVKVTVSAKVKEVKDAEAIGDKLKQDVILADSTGFAKLTLWEEYVTSLIEGRSYRFKNLVVKSYQSSKYLSRGEGTDVDSINDIGIVATTSCVAEECCSTTLNNCIVVGVPELETYKLCLKCKSRVEPVSSLLGSCSNCRMMQRYSICTDSTTAKLLVMYDDSGSQRKMMQVLVFGENLLHKWIGGETRHEVTQELLLTAPAVSIEISEKKVVQEVHL